jgi:predicted phage terminase large subunit-like protein
MNAIINSSDYLTHEETLQKAKLLGSFLLFTRIFYKLRTGREFNLSEPVSRETHFITITRELTNLFRSPEHFLRDIINVPPGHGKSELVIHWVAWCLAHYPDCNFIYISFGQELAAGHTATIKQIVSLPYYKKLFNVRIRTDSSAKDDFTTTAGGRVKAFGSKGPITGMNAGLPITDRFSGAVIMDDMHKPDEVFSDTIRESVIENYRRTIKPRPRSPRVPILFIGQRLHEDDLPGYLLSGRDGYSWRRIILKSIDENGNILYPEIDPREKLEIEEKTNPYVFSSQYQQEPTPAGGTIFKPEWFVTLSQEPNILATFITVDTAETDKNYNDATVFSFWGLYWIEEAGVEINKLSLHWLDCREIRVEPKDLEDEFRQFYSDCLHHPVQPQIAAIEKKSTGVTLASTLSQMRGLKIIDINRTATSGNKAARYIEIQKYVAAGLISFPKNAKHIEMCVTQARKITLNNAHAHDDIIDTMYDGVKIGLINKSITSVAAVINKPALPLKSLTNKMTDLRRAAYGRGSR